MNYHSTEKFHLWRHQLSSVFTLLLSHFSFLGGGEIFMGFNVHLGPDQRHSPKDKGKGIRIHNLTLAWLKLLYVITLFTTVTYWTKVVIMSKVCFMCVWLYDRHFNPEVSTRYSTRILKTVINAQLCILLTKQHLYKFSSKITSKGP